MLRNRLRRFRTLDGLVVRPHHRRNGPSPGLVAKVTGLLLLTALVAGAQLVTDTLAIPRTEGKPPVIFVNGYQAGCEGSVTFDATFGVADQVLQRDGRVSLFFNNCEQARNAPIEEIGAAFRRFVDGLQYADGQPVPQVDVVAHSMGGLIVRSYLSGKQVEQGLFNPPADVKMRKGVFLAVPFFGSVAATLPFAPNDTQTRQLTPGSEFLFDLATWNQGIDDLRGIDAIAVVANGGNGQVGGSSRLNDSTVSVTSASLEFASTGRTRVVNHCHTTGLAQLACNSGIPAVARITGDQHDTARILLSFLNGTEEWRGIGDTPASAPHLAQRGGLQAQFRDAQDRVVPIDSVSTTAGTVQVRNREILWSESLQATDAVRLTATASTGTVEAQVPLITGGARALVVTTAGPAIAGAFPVFSTVAPRAVAPGSFVSIYGTALANASAAAEGLPYPDSLANTEVRMNGRRVPLHYVSPSQINAVVPEDAGGLVKLTVLTPAGQRTVNVLVEPSVPSVFDSAVNARTGALVTSDAPARAGEYISLYVTGLGTTERRADGLDWARIQPEVSAGGLPCALQFAGRAPGFVGLDQINCRLAEALPASGSTSVTIRSGNRAASVSMAVTDAMVE